MHNGSEHMIFHQVNELASTVSPDPASPPPRRRLPRPASPLSPRPRLAAVSADPASPRLGAAVSPDPISLPALCKHSPLPIPLLCLV